MYTEIKKIFDELNNDPSHFTSNNDICTPMDCVEEMIDMIPQELWNRDHINILDPCAGNGNFPLYILEKVKNKYHLQLNEINPLRLKNIRKYFDTDKITITEQDFLTFSNDGFFDDNSYDLIIANPPYAKFDNTGNRSAKNHNMSRDFVKKALELLNDNGYMVFIIPDNWMSLSDRNNIVKLLSEYQFIYINIHGAKKYFPKVGSSFTWFVLHKTPNSKNTIIQNTYRKRNIVSVRIDRGMSNIPLYYDENVRSIIRKTLYSNNKKIGIRTSSLLHRHTKKNIIRNTKDQVFRYKLYHTQKQTVYSSSKHIYHDMYKVFISTTSYYGTFIDTNCGMTQSIAFVLCDNEEHAIQIKNILDHPLYVFLNDIHRYGNFNNIRILQMFPLPNTDDIYGYFNITKQEQKLIQEIIQ
jgi:methylase of polypeptide subunit release factors